MKTLAIPVPPIERVQSTPECYKREKQKSGWYYWLIPSPQDPKNAFLANWAVLPATLEGMALVGFAVASDVLGGHLASMDKLPFWIGLAFLALLACWGYRGMVAGHVRRAASCVLFYSNGALFVLISLSLLKLWWDYRE
ncbi:hypothetical protein DES53_11948 [Roseimicrobium gellanilyticum]|uniref:Uncharacterized protein n=1 Tax=Roseimicrobium gellanilyticum TaxID=748857 RepID=A0A366H1W9_9BACT|nr:hypothetical protein [Roseimicrobium gellanilyticum]RBP35882.1 hypothetical protein DES53_11948 [Roseimicrobium gellanilyticum]